MRLGKFLVFFSLQLAFELAVFVMLALELPELLRAVLLVFGEDSTPVVVRSKAFLTPECFCTGLAGVCTAVSVLMRLFVIRAGLFDRLTITST